MRAAQRAAMRPDLGPGQAGTRVFDGMRGLATEIVVTESVPSRSPGSDWVELGNVARKAFGGNRS